MWTVTEMAKSCGLSRSTLLYYESIGLLRPPARSAGNYRHYGERDQERLRQVCLYREAGLALTDIKAILDRKADDASDILQRRLLELNAEIDRLRNHQRVIFRLLQLKPPGKKGQPMTKEKWTGIMRASGFSDQDMKRWHHEFEKAAPEDHQKFLEYLQIGKEEITRIRTWSAQPPPAQ